MTSWRTYEEVATFLLDQFAEHFGLQRVESKQLVPSQSSEIHWEIDAKGIREGGDGFLIVECRRHGSRLNQEKVAGLAFRITDTGAHGGIIVSPMGLQAGAAKIAASNDIESVKLRRDSSTRDYLMRFLKRIMFGALDSISLSDAFHAVLNGQDGLIKEVRTGDQSSASPEPPPRASHSEAQN